MEAFNGFQWIIGALKALWPPLMMVTLLIFFENEGLKDHLLIMEALKAFI